MTLVVCPNLAIDRVLAATAVRPGATMRCRALFQQAGGKGANVARALGLLGGGALLTGFAAGHAGRLFADLAAGEGLEVDLVAGVGEVRVSTVVLADDGRVTRLYEYGPRIGPAEERALTHAVAAHHAAPGEWALVTGAAPPGAAAGLYAGLVSTLHAGGYHVMVDATEAQLAGALAAGPDFVKVNLDEACTAVGGPNADCVDASRAPGDERRAEALELSRRLVAAGAASALVTAGAAGAAGLAGNAEWWVHAAPVTVVNPVGSGDCFAAALLLGAERGLPTAAALALAAGAAAANAGTARTGHFDAAVARELAGRASVGPPGS
jgi:tagatose 6-phosphate kinase